MNKTFFLLLLILSMGSSAQISQWRGLERNGIYPEGNYLTSWPMDGPELIMKVDSLGNGWSSAVPGSKLVYVTGKVDTMDVLFAIDEAGEIVWKVPYGSSWGKSFSDARSTPSVDGDKVYVSSGSGFVACIDGLSGEIIWQHNSFAKNEGETGNWGVAESLLLVDDKVIFTTGGGQALMVALDKNTGEEIWNTPGVNEQLAYVSPILIEFNNKQQIVGLTAKTLYGVNPENGEMEWSYDYYSIDSAKWGKNSAYINCTSPLYHNGELYVTSGYNHIAAKFRLNEDMSKVSLVWKDENLDNHHGGVVLIDGYIYGSNWITNGSGNWCCLDWETGELMYEEEFHNKGSIISANNYLYLYTEKRGYVALVKADPNKFEVISNFRIEEGKGAHWAHPTIHDGKLYIRHGEVLMVYNIEDEQ